MGSQRGTESHNRLTVYCAPNNRYVDSVRSPYAFEPGLEEEARVEVFGQRSASGKKQHYLGPNQIAPYGKYSYKVVMEKPFWEQVLIYLLCPF